MSAMFVRTAIKTVLNSNWICKIGKVDQRFLRKGTMSSGNIWSEEENDKDTDDFSNVQAQGGRFNQNVNRGGGFQRKSQQQSNFDSDFEDEETNFASNRRLTPQRTGFNNYRQNYNNRNRREDYDDQEDYGEGFGPRNKFKGNYRQYGQNYGNQGYGQNYGNQGYGQNYRNQGYNKGFRNQDYGDHRNNNGGYRQNYRDNRQNYGAQRFDRNNDGNSRFDEQPYTSNWMQGRQHRSQAWKTNIPRYNRDNLHSERNLPDRVFQSKKPQESTFEENPFNLTPENQLEIIADIMCPLAKNTYSHQLHTKYNSSGTVLRKLMRALHSVRANIEPCENDYPCPLNPTKPSPVITEYRNKDEFSIWPGLDGNRKTVGFFAGMPSKHKNVICVEADKCIITKESHKVIAKEFQTYLREHSPYDVCTNFTEGGNWRRLFVRSNEAGEHMVVAIMHPQELNYDQIQEEKNRIRSYFDPLMEKLKITSLFFQACPGVRCPGHVAPFQLLSGDEIIRETISGLTFRISPEAFFQVNTKGAEVLYDTVINELELSPEVTVLDLCCGVGTMSLLVAPHVQRVIGIEQSQAAIDDAKKNAEENNIKNCTFVAGTVEEVLPTMEEDLIGRQLYIIANPSRDGFKSSTIRFLRTLPSLQKIVYISCRPEGLAFQNFVDLCLPPRRGNSIENQFIPSNATPVDLFPHTQHYELVLSFERTFD